MNIEQNFIDVCHQIHQAEQQCNVLEGNVRLLAVSKKKPADMIRQLWKAGQRDFGENFVQEAIDKIQQLKDLVDICWHLIGPLQSNKTQQVASFFHWVHSIDRLRIAKRLNDQRPEHMAPLNICIQVNVSNESSKSGVNIHDVFSLAESIIALPHLHLRGLMTIPQKTDFSSSESVNGLRTDFKIMHKLYLSMQQAYPDQKIDMLSMGMSQDMNIAIEEGSTCIRVGTALFGKRD